MNSNEHRLKDERKDVEKIEDYAYNKKRYLPSFNNKAFLMLQKIEKENDEELKRRGYILDDT
jgi:hypothetical protein